MMSPDRRRQRFSGHIVEREFTDQDIDARARKGRKERVTGMPGKYHVVSLLFEDPNSRASEVCIGGDDQDGASRRNCGHHRRGGGVDTIPFGIIEHLQGTPKGLSAGALSAKRMPRQFAPVCA